MTDEEAKRHWCPQARSPKHIKINGVDFLSSANRGSGLEDNCLCVGSKCMAWRWDIPKDPTRGQHSHGYCGLAGSPWQQ